MTFERIILPPFIDNDWVVVHWIL